MATCLDAEERCRYDSDAILTPVGLSARGNYRGIKQSFPKLLSQPVEMTNVFRADRPGQLYLQSDHSLVKAFDDQVDLVATILGA